MEWKKVLGSIAPTLATALGGPLAGTATKFIADKFLGNETASDDEIQQAILGATPAQLAELKKIDKEFKLEMERLNVDVFRLEVADKDSARQNNKDSRMPATLSIMLTFVVAVLMYALFIIEPPSGAKEALLLLLGVVIKEWSNSMHYWFGTTRGSSDKNKWMQKP